MDDHKIRLRTIQTDNFEIAYSCSTNNIKQYHFNEVGKDEWMRFDENQIDELIELLNMVKEVM